MSANDYAKPKGDKDCPPHRLGLAKPSRAHLWTDRDNETNWMCSGVTESRKQR